MKFSASLDHLQEMLHFIRSQASDFGFNDILAAKIELAVEEALVNVIRHGYMISDGMIEIICTKKTSPKCFEVVIKDQGIPFNPLKDAPFIDNDVPLEKKPIGGYGIYLIRKIMDSVSYERVGNSNILILTKEL